MALTRKEKEAVVAELNEKLARSVLVVVTSFSGLSVSSVNELRSKLREVSGEFKVAKNTLIKIAAKDTQLEELSDQFVGPNALVIGYDDPVSVAKTIVEFQKENEGLQIKSGVLNGKVVDSAGLEALSKLPSREVLLAQLLSVLVATPTGLVQALSGIPRKLLYALKGIEEQKAQG